MPHAIAERPTPTRTTPRSRAVAWSWRMQRLMLTPGFLLLPSGGPAVDRRLFGRRPGTSPTPRAATVIGETVAEARSSFENRPEFMVKLMAVDGADDTVVSRNPRGPAAGFSHSVPSISTSTRSATVSLHCDPVKSATVRIRPGGVLQVDGRAAPAGGRLAHGRRALDGRCHGGACCVPAEPDGPAGPAADRRRGRGTACDRSAGNLPRRSPAWTVACAASCAWASGAGMWCWTATSGSCLPEAGAVAGAGAGASRSTARRISWTGMSPASTCALAARPTVQMSQYASDVLVRIIQTSFGAVTR